MRSLGLLLLCWLGIAAGQALAQDRGVSYSTWIVSDDRVTLRFVLPVSEAQRLTGSGLPLLTTNRLEDYLLQHLAVGSAGGDCPAIDQGFDLGRVDPLAVGPDLYGFEIFFRCSDPRRLVLRNDALFGESPGHVNFASIQRRGQSAEQLFTAQQRRLTLPDDRVIAGAGFGAYLQMGVMHIVRNADRWCFVLGLLVLVRQRREIGWLGAALAAGYVLALLLDISGWVLPRLTLLESFMGLLLAGLGILVIERESRAGMSHGLRWPALALLLTLVAAVVHVAAAGPAFAGGAVLGGGLLVLARRRGDSLCLWPILAGLFAFLDGFVLPAVLPPAQLPQRLQLQMLAGFGLGALLFDALLVGGALAIWKLLRTRGTLLPRSVLNDLSAAALCGLGSYWLLSRLA